MLQPMGQLQNIYRSLDRYALEQLVTNRGLTVRYHGERRFVPPVDAAWAELHYEFLGLSGVFRRAISVRVNDDTTRETVQASERQGMLQVNVFQRARTFATRYLIYAARDVVVEAFPESLSLAIYDYQNAVDPDPPAQVGLLQFAGYTEHTQDLALRSGVLQHVVQIYTRYLEGFVTRVDALPGP